MKIMMRKIHRERIRQLVCCIALALIGLPQLAVDAFAPSFANRRPQHHGRRFIISSRSNNQMKNVISLASSNISTKNSSSNPIHKATSSLRSTLRTATGLSLTTLRTTLRAATGISLSRQLTSIISAITGVLPAGIRYFLQPFLIMYYAPMMIVRYYMVGPSRKYVEESQKGHERVVKGWKRAVEAAEKAQEGGYWPVHLNEDGSITASLPPDPEQFLDVTDGIEKSVELEQELSQKL